MGYAVYRISNNRWGGYGIPAYCEHPDCNEEIDRGMSYACGGEPFSEKGCDRYFCGKHLQYHAFNAGGERILLEVCKRCATHKPPYPYKPEHPTWIEHLLTDESWQKWRDENKAEVAELTKRTIGVSPIPTP